MLHDFITAHRNAIIARTRERVGARPSSSASVDELEIGIPLLLSQIAETLRWESTATPFSTTAIGDAASRRGRELLALGLTVSEVVHGYGDVCQAITAIALEHRAPITTKEFHTLNRCLDTAIAEAVTEHARETAQSRSAEEVERVGQLTHEIRDVLDTALLAFQSLKRGDVAINGSTGAVLGRSLMNLRGIVDSTLCEVRMAGTLPRREPLLVAPLVDGISAIGGLHAECRGLHFVVEPVDAALAVDGDPQLLASAVTAILNNAFKFTLAGGRVVLRARSGSGRLLIEVEDECGGLPQTQADPFQAFGERRASDRSGLGLGLSIARKAVRAHSGDIHVRNLPGRGCVFVIDVPLGAAAPESAVS